MLLIQIVSEFHWLIIRCLSLKWFEKLLFKILCGLFISAKIIIADASFFSIEFTFSSLFILNSICVLKEIISLLYFLEFLDCIRFFAQIRMILFHHVQISCLQLFGSEFGSQAQQVVIVRQRLFCWEWKPLDEVFRPSWGHYYHLNYYLIIKYDEQNSQSSYFSIFIFSFCPKNVVPFVSLW